MYSQDPKVRRRRLQLRFFYYGVMTVSVIALTVVGVFFILGYRINLEKNTVNVSRGGLLKFNTQPTGAAVYFDGSRLATNTPHQVNITSGKHQVSYSKEGYQTWQKDIQMHPGELLLLNYARLIPNSITTTSLRSLPTLHQTLASPDREWLALHELPEAPTILLTDARNERSTAFTTLVLSEAVFSKKPNVASSFQIMEWSGDSKFLLIKHMSGQDVEYIRVPRDDQARAVNMTKLFNMPLASMHFSNNNANVLYATDQNNSLYRLDINRPGNKVHIADGIGQFDDLSDDKIAFIAPSADKNKKDTMLSIWQAANQKTTVIKTIPVGQPVLLVYSPYLSKEYLSVTIGQSLTVYESPLSTGHKTLQSSMLPFTPVVMAASPGGRFVMLQAGEAAVNYDIELKTSYTLHSPGETRQPLQWIDDYHLALTGGSGMRFVEFDGTNMQQVTQVAPGYDAMIGIDGRIFLSIGRNSTSGGLELQQSQLLTPADQNAGLF
ncbi:MAG TPA: PEGA domain-containing protein [Candidatus Saccharimonadales bacterium]